MITHSVFHTKLGWMGVVRGEKGLKKVILPSALFEDVEAEITGQFPDSVRDDTALQPLTKRLEAYYRGKRFSQDISLDWSGSTSFSIAVWRGAQSIPWGEVRTYQWLSLYLDKPRSFRAVGGALGRNPFPIIVPCHRVIRGDGTLGGFSAPTGIRLKRKMLELEGVRIDKQGKVIRKGE
jgi:methylated-DNA-[protein]-cysteine S-methyltransferase